jgi:hypothetical protein
MEEAVHESTDAQQLAQAVSMVTTTLAGTFGCHTFPDTQLNKTFVRAMTSALKEKVTELAQNDKNLEGKILKAVIDATFDDLHDSTLQDGGHVSPSGARITLQLLNGLFR